MTPNAILRKTEAGALAIKSRDKALMHKERMVLIMVDGAKTVKMLSQACAGLDEALQLCAHLVAAGWAETVPGTAVAAPAAQGPAAPAPDVPAAPAPAQDIGKAIRRATRALEDLLGPSCEPLALQLEKCKNHEQLAAKILELKPIVASMRSEKKADEFIAAARGL